MIAGSSGRSVCVSKFAVVDDCWVIVIGPRLGAIKSLVIPLPVGSGRPFLTAKPLRFSQSGSGVSISVDLSCTVSKKASNLT